VDTTRKRGYSVSPKRRLALGAADPVRHGRTGNLAQLSEAANVESAANEVGVEQRDQHDETECS
jgi:hypothetical protein